MALYQRMIQHTGLCCNALTSYPPCVWYTTVNVHTTRNSIHKMCDFCTILKPYFHRKNVKPYIANILTTNALPYPNVTEVPARVAICSIAPWLLVPIWIPTIIVVPKPRARVLFRCIIGNVRCL